MDELHQAEDLARSYKEKGEKSNNWTDYLKAHGLANYCLVKDPTPNRRRLVYEVENSWYKGKHPLTYEQHEELTKKHKKLLQKFRKDALKEYKRVEQKCRALNILDDVFTTGNMAVAEKFALETFKVSEKCTKQFIEVSRSIISSSVSLLHGSGRSAPCKFSVLGLGSVAKGEVTPYSDLEYAFIVEHEDEYFEALAVDSYFRIGNMGETPLKCFDIEELKVEKGSPPILSSIGTVGYRIDGITKKAGNIPTGNGREDGQKLTLTVDRLMELYRTSAESPFDGVAGDKSDMLSSTVVIYTNEGRDSQLHQEFLERRKTYEREVAVNQSVARKRLESFVQDIRSYTFLPEFVKFQPPKNSHIEVKVDVFRYPTLLANHMKLWLGLEENYSWKVFKKMEELGKLSEHACQHLRIILAISLYMRTSIYLYNKSQTGVISFNLLMLAFQKPLHPPPFQLFVMLGCLLIPIKQYIKSYVDKLMSLVSQNPNPSLNLSTTLTTLVNKLKLGTTNFLQQAEVLYFVGVYPVAMLLLERTLQCSLRSTTSSRFAEILKQTDSKPVFIRKYVELACYLLYHTSEYQSTIGYLDWLISTQSGDNGLWLLLKAHCAKETQDFKTAGELLQRVKGLPHQTYLSAPAFSSLPFVESAYESGSANVETAQSLCNIGMTYWNLAEFEEAKQFLFRALSMFKELDCETPLVAACYRRLGMQYEETGNYKLAMENYNKSLQITSTNCGLMLYVEEAALVHGNMGNMCSRLEEYDKALEHYFKSLHMLISLYGPQSKERLISHCYNNIGNVYIKMDKPQEAKEYFYKALEMRKAIYGADSTHPDIAACYNNLGNVYRMRKDCSTAGEFYKKALGMKRAEYGAETNHPEIANSLVNLAQICLEFDNYDMAWKYAIEGHRMRIAIYGADAKHSSIARSLQVLGCVCRVRGEQLDAAEYFTQSVEMSSSLGDIKPENSDLHLQSWAVLAASHIRLKEYELALKYYKMSKRVLLAIHGDSEHVDIAHFCMRIGKMNHRLGHYKPALDHYIKALEIEAKLYPSFEEEIWQIDKTSQSPGDFPDILQDCLDALTVIGG